MSKEFKLKRRDTCSMCGQRYEMQLEIDAWKAIYEGQNLLISQLQEEIEQMKAKTSITEPIWEKPHERK